MFVILSEAKNLCILLSSEIQKFSQASVGFSI